MKIMSEITKEEFESYQSLSTKGLKQQWLKIRKNSMSELELAKLYYKISSIALRKDEEINKYFIDVILDK